uniref:Ribosomal protein L10 n=1 Tax=Reclinomonas americana TaxID=48483 RepID=O21236_RECAM|nr:ribosomal protein L10 [Reclinomonas americana]AAD11863.1 ribosomal protein L10 [Reclinomonas americana]
MRKHKKLIVSEEYVHIFDTFPFVIVFHYNNTVVDSFSLEKKKQELQQFIENACIQKNIKQIPFINFKVIKNKLMKSSLEKSRYKNIINLFSGPTLLLYTTEANSFICDKIIEWKKKNKNFILLGGKYETNLVSVADLLEITKISLNKEDEIVKNISFINSSVVQLTQSLSQNQVSILNLLQVLSQKEDSKKIL